VADTSIEWTEKSWNAIRGCSLKSAGCTNCYAQRVAHRFSRPGGTYEGLTRSRKTLGPVWTGDVRFVPEKLDEPLHWKKPVRVFVNSMSDLFHEELADEHIAAIFGIMAAAPQHTFQCLTKRPARAREWFRWVDRTARFHGSEEVCDVRRLGVVLHHAQAFCDAEILRISEPILRRPWPLPNVWLGVSVEDQATADERIPLLLGCPAAVRWVSYEPALGPVVFQDRVGVRHPLHQGSPMDGLRAYLRPSKHASREARVALDWVVVGGESGPGARPFDLAWARSTIAQCREAEVPVFVKQLGAKPIWVSDFDFDATRIHDRKGGDIAEFPADLRVREYPR
jgi:protein gp37